MDVQLTTVAEEHAREAEHLRAFTGLNLLHVKRQVALLLQQIGAQGIFDEYTRHDISHINEMLSSLTEWIIPPSTQRAMTTADWLLAVLSIYFHDIGMLVTKREYRDRHLSDFPRYRNEELFSNDDRGKDYRAKVATLPEEERERFLYQEFVRAHHAKRSRAWVIGSATSDLGVADDVAGAIDDLLRPLDRTFRRDLGLVCESHHERDLDNVDKYKPSQPYGNSSAEVANLQYAAILLRTADLLHITRDRTPSIVFRALNPADPLSQREWAKQMAVRSVRSQLARDVDGNANPDLPRDTVEVHASFAHEDGFFGLTSYLSYAEQQLKDSHHWVMQARRQFAVPHEFPWRRIDQTRIETEGFLATQFEFTIDQAKVLDLLTGHTLYNDTSVVLRELVQNAIDAVRLQFYDPQRTTSRQHGRVCIEWHSRSRVLTVRDNGTGMTQAVIENHLLKVGASRYQDPKFKERWPDFTSISRFGIGVLSAFMIADEVEVVTCSPEDEKARRLVLRSVHGKYLIRLLEKSTHDVACALSPHGTQFRLVVRPSAGIGDVVATAAKWIVVPECYVTVRVDGDDPHTVGFASPKEALEDALRKAGILKADGRAERRVEVLQRERNGVVLAYAVYWDDHFREWAFLRQRERASARDAPSTALGTCVEGIRVEFDTPGFAGQPIYAIANATGPLAPRTNVARSGLERAPETISMLQTCYALYAEHVASEIEKLHGERSFSLTWAVGEANYLLDTILDYRPVRYARDARPVDLQLLLDALAEIPLLVVEKRGKRNAISTHVLSDEDEFWTIDSDLFRSLENLLKEIPRNASLGLVTEALGGDQVGLPDGMLLCSVEKVGVRRRTTVFAQREAAELRVQSDQRRVDIRWVRRNEPPRWMNPEMDFPPMPARLRETLEEAEHLYGFSHRPNLVACRGPVALVGVPDNVIAVATDREIFVLPGNDMSRYLLMAGDHDQESLEKKWTIWMVAQIILADAESGADALADLDRLMENHQFVRKATEEWINVPQLRAILGGREWKIYSNRFWRREHW